jgi:phosphohistidine phosphatase
VHPSIILSSPALRAFTTARIICTEIGFDVNKIEIEPVLYFKEASEIINNIQEKSSLHDTIMLFGHNPAFSHLSHMLCPEFNDTMPTCSVVSIGFDVEAGNLIAPGAGKLCYFEYPKKYRH